MKKLLTLLALMFVALTANAQSCPDNHHPHMIDLGLPSGTKWSCCNVGADKPEAYGGYYAWGETEEKDYYYWDTYIHCDGSKETCHDLGDDIAGTQYDVAYVKWGGSWVMPSLNQIEELYDNCTWTWTTQNGVYGRAYTGPNGGSIFLPAAGYRHHGSFDGARNYGYYWSSTQYPSNSSNAYYMYFSRQSMNKSNVNSRFFGRTVRPVSTESPAVPKPPSTIRGDVNGDKAINVTDAVMTVSHVMGDFYDDFLSVNADVNIDGDINITDVVTIVNIILTGKGVSSIELPEGAAISASDLTIYSDGEQVDVGDNGLLGTCIGDMMAFNGDSLVYLSYGSDDDRTLNSLETAVSLLLPIIPYAVTDMDNDTFWLLKQMIGHLEQTRTLASAIDQSIIDKGYLDMDAVKPQYVAAVAEINRRLGFDGSEPAYSPRNKIRKTTYPIFVYGNKEAHGDGFTLVKDHTLWGTGENGDCWKCDFTVFNRDRWCYTSLSKAWKKDDGTFERQNTGISDSFTNLIKPMNVSAFMDWGTWSDMATNPKDWLTHLTDFDFERVASLFWDPIQDFGHLIRGEDLENSTWDQVKKSGIKFDLYPDNEHLVIFGPGSDDALMLFNYVKIVACPFLKMFIKELKKTDEYDKSDPMDKLLIYFTEWMCKDATFVADHVIAKVTDTTLPLDERYLSPIEDVIGKFFEFCVKEDVINDISEIIYEIPFNIMGEGFENPFDDPEVKALFKAYKTTLTVGDIILFLLDNQYWGVGFEMDYGPSYEEYHQEHSEDYTVGDVTFTMVHLPGGPFMMGVEPNELLDIYAADNEKPLHYVNLNDFSIGETEVTQGLWKAVMGSNPSTFQNDDLPVNNVTWEECQQFITKLNQLTGRHFRLPTEAEWEFAASGGMYKRGYPYAGSNNILDVGWYIEDCGLLHPVKEMNANEFGLYDMSGNVMEWCQDYYDGKYYKNSPEDNPCNTNQGSDEKRVNRGGSFRSSFAECRVSYRGSDRPYSRSDAYGLRLAMDGYQLVLSTNMLYLAEGGKCTVNILSGSGNYTVESSNPSVATAEIDDNLALKRIWITAVSADDAIITVRDTETGQTAEIQVVVTPAQTFTANGVSFRMVPVDGDTFWMGADDNDSGANSDERPRHLVALNSYSIGETEVTQALWQAVMGENPSEFEMLGGNNPVENVSWKDCQTFISKLNAMTGKNFRLPTEAEWEFAARGGKNTDDYTYAGGNDIDAMGWYVGNSTNYTHPVASKLANIFGICDMTGNVWEWCHDSYAENYYSTSPSMNPCNTAVANNRVARGGSWADAAPGCRLVFRGNAPADRRDSDTGLRLALSGENATPLTLSATSLYLAIGGQGTVNITSGSGKYTVESSDPAVATAEIENSTVKITAISMGEASIMVRDTQTGDMVYVQVKVSNTSLQLSTNTLTVTKGGQGTVDITSGSGSYAAVSNATSVATVTVDGSKVVITAVSPGSATITVKDNQTQERAKIEVTVTNTPQAYLSCPDDHHPHLIDLGLPSGTKWACCNVDDDHSKQSPTNYGSYYAWGEVKGKDYYSQDTYEYYKNGNYVDLGSDIAGTQYDVAHVKWGGSWVMPSREQQDELRNNCTYTWTSVNGVEGGRFTGPNGGSIFLPAAGYRWFGDLYSAGGYGHSWSSTQYPSDSGYAYILLFDSGSAYWHYNDRSSGQSVRPVSR